MLNFSVSTKAISLSMLLFVISFDLQAQNAPDSFFTSQAPFKISFAISLKTVEKSRQDTVYLKQKIYYQNAGNKRDSINVGIKERGNFRSKQCYYPPLWIKIKKQDAKGTVFEGVKKIKVVLPCYDTKEKNSLILREYLCYKLFEEVTPYSFQTRLADVDLTIIKNNNKRTESKLKGIFIEDIDRTAARLNAKELKNVKLHPMVLSDTAAVRFEFFQFMIANTDWSTVHQHNTKLVAHGNDKYISIMYDFDMSGLVDAPYAAVSVINGEQLNIEHVTHRLYRGFCRDPRVMEFVRQEYIAKEEKYLKIPDQLAGGLDADEIDHIKAYLKEFFSILKNDVLFRQDILDNCRVK